MPVDPDSPIPRSAAAGLQAVLEPVSEPVPDGIVVTAWRAGFIRGDKDVRRAEVIVARTPVGGE